MKQERFNPSTNVSNWQGRSEYLKGYPGKAMSEALNGGFFGAASQRRELGQFLASGSGTNQYMISNIPTTDFHDLEVWFKASNQSGWVTQWNLEFYSGSSNLSNSMNSAHYYAGYSSGRSNGAQFQSAVYNYPAGFSSYGHTYHLYISNYSSTSNIKSWHGFGGYTNGSAFSYVTWQQNGGTINSSSVIDGIRISTGNGNGSSSYQGWAVFGRRPKT